MKLTRITDNKFLLDNDNVSFISFPAGETHAIISKEIKPFLACAGNSIYYKADITNAQDHISLLMVLNALKNVGTTYVKLILPYLPYGRADRHFHDIDCFGLEAFLNSLHGNNLFSISTIDKHSFVFYTKVTNILPSSEIMKAIDDFTEHVGETPTILFPDAGALSRYNWLPSSPLKNPLSFCQASKVREPVSGKLSGFLTPRLEGPVLIIDDICDGGGTYVGISESLQRYNRSKNLTLGLFTTHGIYSKGLDTLTNAGYTKIYSTDSYPNTLQNSEIYTKFPCYDTIVAHIKKGTI